MIVLTGPLKPNGQPRVVGRIGVVVDLIGELLAVGESDCVGPGKGNHFLEGEVVLAGEDGDHVVESHGGAGEMAVDGGGGRNEAVFAAEEDGVERAAEEGDEVTGGDGEDVGAGDDAGTFEFEGGFGSNDDVEAVAGEGEVDIGVAFGGVEGGGGDEGGGVAAGDEAVMEEEAEGGGGGGGGFDLFVGGGLFHYLFEFGAGFGVVVDGEI